MAYCALRRMQGNLMNRAFPEKESYTAEDLVAIIALLRDPENGCPWDKVQTHRSIRMNFLEEAYEAVDAIDLADPQLLCEELGDVLMQVAFHAQIEQEAGRFSWQQVCDGVCRKLIERHPHIFGGDTSIKDWDALKNKEKGRLTLQDDLASVPRGPAGTDACRQAAETRGALRRGCVPRGAARGRLCPGPAVRNRAPGRRGGGRENSCLPLLLWRGRRASIRNRRCRSATPPLRRHLNLMEL